MTCGPEMGLGSVWPPRGSEGPRVRVASLGDEFLARVWTTRIVCVSRAAPASRLLRSYDGSFWSIQPETGGGQCGAVWHALYIVQYKCKINLVLYLP
jgi:hypothetical protein